MVEREGSYGISLDTIMINPTKTGGAPRQRCIFASIVLDLMVFKMATADADEGYSRLPKQNTGGSDAFCLGDTPVSGTS
jgi:hypothetical protein